MRSDWLAQSEAESSFFDLVAVFTYGRVRSDWLAQSEAESSFFGLVAVFHTAENENGGRKNTSSFVFFRSAPNVSVKKKNEGKPIG